MARRGMALALEKTSEEKIVNPATGGSSWSFVPAPRVDGIVRIADDHFLLEHKTTSQIDADHWSACGQTSRSFSRPGTLTERWGCT